MATFKAVVLKDDKRRDLTFNVKIRVIHNRKIGIIGTEHYIKRSFLNSKYEIINQDVLATCDDIISRYRKQILAVDNLDQYTVKQLIDFLKRDKNKDIDFLAFIDTVTQALRKRGKLKTMATYNTTKNNLKAYIGMDVLSITLITSKFLQGFEQWLRHHYVTQGVAKGRKGSQTLVELSDTSINLYMRNIRALFNMAREEYNNEDIGDIQIKHYPFSKYKMPTALESQNRNLSIEDIIRIRDYQESRKLDGFARDVFMISFYLIGMNTVDLFYCPKTKDGRVTYNRTKTKGKRKDKAMMSIQIQPELKPYMEKYAGKKTCFDFSERYVNPSNFNKHVNVGLNRIGIELELPMSLTTYWARHSWATIAANDCRIDDSIIQKCLNHSVAELKTTRIYIRNDWSIIDEANSKVLALLKEKEVHYENSQH